eukprot:PITA_35942
MDSTSTSMGMCNTQLPQLNWKNYYYWAITMRALFASQDLWEFIEDGFEEPADGNLLRMVVQDSKALHFLYQEVHESVFPRIVTAKISKQAWQTLKTAYQGMEKVKTAKLQLLRRDFENLCIKESDNIDSFFKQVIGLITQIRSHGEILEETGIGEKLLRVLPSKFDVIVTSIEETKDLTNFLLDELHASLITHEQRLSRNENSSLEQAFKTQMSFGRGRVLEIILRGGVNQYYQNQITSNQRQQNRAERQSHIRTQDIRWKPNVGENHLLQFVSIFL